MSDVGATHASPSSIGTPKKFGRRMRRPYMRDRVPEVLEQIDAVAAEAATELSAVKDSAQLETFRIKFLGSNGKVKGLMKLLGQVPKDQKPAIGQRANAVNQKIQADFESKKTELSAAGAGATSRDALDVTEP